MNIEHLLYDYLVSIGQSEASAKYLNLFAAYPKGYIFKFILMKLYFEEVSKIKPIHDLFRANFSFVGPNRVHILLRCIAELLEDKQSFLFFLAKLSFSFKWFLK